VLGVRSLDYYIEINSNLSRENQSLTKINAINVAYIEQLEGLNEALSEELNDGLKAKKKWRNATLLIGGIFISTLLLAQL
jgi:hypothetical protein